MEETLFYLYMFSELIDEAEFLYSFAFLGFMSVFWNEVWFKFNVSIVLIVNEGFPLRNYRRGFLWTGFT